MIPNLCDVGETINILSGIDSMPEKVLYRGGTVNNLFDEAELPPIATILNLRTGEDKHFPSVRNIHIPAENSVENYQTSHVKVKNWANRVISAISDGRVFPLLIIVPLAKTEQG